TLPDNVDTSNLTYKWLIDGTLVSETDTLDITTSGYYGEQEVLLYILNGELEYYVTALVDFGDNNANQSPVASFSYTNNTLTATSTDDAGSNNLTHTWFADNQSIGSGSTWDTSSLTGILTIKLTTTDADNLSDSTEQQIDFGTVTPINTAPVAVATSNLTSGSIPLTVTFDGSASSDNEDSTLTYSWSFSDGTSSNLASPSKTFNTPGNYTATLIVSDSENASTTASIINITAISPEVDLPPVANITKNISSGETPLTVSFSASTSSDDKSISSYSWNFGDGSATTSGVSVTHIYDTEGVYTATLTVTDDAGQSTQATTQITVEAVIDLAPIAVLTTNATTGEAPLAINFNASTSSDDNAISSYSWNFGDGSTIMSGVSVTHTYTDAGVYTATLTVTDDAGQSTQATTQITVEAVIDLDPIAAFTMSSSTGDAPFAVSFNASTSSDDNSISSYTWDFGDGSTAATGITTSHTYTIAGDYTVMLTVTDSSNQTHSVTESITVTAEAIAPTANFTVIATELSVAVDAITSTDADGDSLTYDWTFNDQTGATVHTASGVTATYEFASEGIKSITLMVTDVDLLTDTSTQSITLTIADDTTEPVNGNGTIIFSEDYEDQTVGENPAGWGVNIAYNIQMTPGATAYADKVRVVDDAPGRDGKALYVDGTGLNSSQNYSIMPLDLSVVDNVERVYVRYYVYATTNYIGNRALTPSGAQPNHNHFMSLGVSHSAEMRIGEI
ncbi:PKD domain-containing protein, partial [Psychromonas sp.]|nr:PKD domain-containing protein [Psychromonas sp.]